MTYRFFTVDRRKRLKSEGQIINLIHYDDIKAPIGDVQLLYGNTAENELQKHADTLFPRGVSEHGDRYFLNPNLSPSTYNISELLDNSQNLSQVKQEISKSLSSSREAVVEILFEYVRRACFPDKPSRFQSHFACETIEQAKRFRETNGRADMSIWEIEGDTFFRADMNLLTLSSSSVLLASYNAHRYWTGLPSIFDNPCWEILLPLPIRALRQIDE